MTQKFLDEVKLSEDDSLEQMKTRPIVKGSPFIVNGTMTIVGNVGSGKTSLIVKLLVIYRREIDPDFFYFHAGTMDSTMSENVNKHNIKLTSIPSRYMEEFVMNYRIIKSAVIELYKYYTRDDYWSEALTEMKKVLKVSSLMDKAKETLKKYSKDSEIKVGDRSFPISKIIDENGNITNSVMIFDDLTQFKEFTGKHAASSFFKELSANTRHFANTSIFSMQRFTYLQKDVRVLSNMWALGYGIAPDDIRELFKQSVSVAGYETKELIAEYEEVDRYEFLLINSGLAIVDFIKVNK